MHGKSWVRGDVSCSRDDARDGESLKILFPLIAVGLVVRLAMPLVSGWAWRMAAVATVEAAGWGALGILARMRWRTR